MKLPPRHLPEPSRFLVLFPLFSLIFHLTLFFLLQSLSSGQHQSRVKEDEIIAMVDLESLNLSQTADEEKPPEALKELEFPLSQPEEAPPSEPESIHLGAEALSSQAGPGALASLPGGAGLPTPEEEMADSMFDAPVPILEEPFSGEADFLPEEAVLFEPDPEEVFQDSEEVLTEPEPVPEEALPPEPDPAAEAPLSDPEPAEQALDLADETTSGSDTGSEAAPEGFLGEEAGGASASGEEVPSDSEQPPSSELAASDFPAGPGAPSSKEGLFSSAQKGIEEAKTAPPPRKKPSKAKIKKVGLLGLLGGGGEKSQRGGEGRLLMAKNTLRSKTRSSEKEPRFPHRSLKTTQKAAGLRRKVVSSEKKRLMKRRPTRRRSRSGGIKIVHGSGRNYGIISSAIRQKKGRLTNVYNRLLQNDENLQGNLIIEFVISPEGRVIKSQVLTSSLGNPSFEKALIKEIRRWKFPSVKTGQTTVLYPLSFFPSS